MEDLGSGALIETGATGGLEHEPTPSEVIRRGVDLVCFSGDKLQWFSQTKAFTMNGYVLCQPPRGDTGQCHGPGIRDVDFALDKNWSLPKKLGEKAQLQFRLEFFNLFNHPQWSDPNVTFANGAFASTRSTIGTQTGNVGTTADYRVIQLALKMNF